MPELAGFDGAEARFFEILPGFLLAPHGAQGLATLDRDTVMQCMVEQVYRKVPSGWPIFLWTWLKPCSPEFSCLGCGAIIPRSLPSVAPDGDPLTSKSMLGESYPRTAVAISPTSLPLARKELLGWLSVFGA